VAQDVHQGSRNVCNSLKERMMKLFHDLFFTDYGLMSFIGIVFMLGMGVFFLRLFLSGAAPKA
jgi:hypothetical protein